MTQPAATQPEDGSASSIGCFKLYQSWNETEGGVWFQDAPTRGATFAAGPPFVLESPYDDFYDVDVSPPLAKDRGDIVGPADDWIEPVQTAHCQDYSGVTADDQVWFTSGIVGVRFSADDGVHYGFVELEFLPGNSACSSNWNPVRWGCNTQPDTPVTIPP